jgi:hypothetical protein
MERGKEIMVDFNVQRTSFMDSSRNISGGGNPFQQPTNISLFATAIAEAQRRERTLINDLQELLVYKNSVLTSNYQNKDVVLQEVDRRIDMTQFGISALIDYENNVKSQIPIVRQQNTAQPSVNQPQQTTAQSLFAGLCSLPDAKILTNSKDGRDFSVVEATGSNGEKISADLIHDEDGYSLQMIDSTGLDTSINNDEVLQCRDKGIYNSAKQNIEKLKGFLEKDKTK